MNEEERAANEAVKRDYQIVFMSPAGERVLADLARFCRAAETCVVPGDRDRTWVLEGRREAFLRIQERLSLTLDELFALSMGRTIRREKDG
jgi:hypothetical protein